MVAKLSLHQPRILQSFAYLVSSHSKALVIIQLRPFISIRHCFTGKMTGSRIENVKKKTVLCICNFCIQGNLALLYDAVKMLN